MKMRLLLVGKTKDDWLKKGIDEYLKRLRPLVKLEVLELPDSSLRTAGDTETVKAREAECCLKHIAPDDFFILLDERGETKTSLEFSSFLARLSAEKSVVFLIGGVYGTASSLRERANAVLSLSPMTFTHQMARLILVEQIYRALMIQANRAYHY